MHGLYVERRTDQSIKWVKIYYGDTCLEYPEITWRETGMGNTYRQTPVQKEMLVTWNINGKSKGKHILLEDKVALIKEFTAWIVVFDQGAMELYRQSSIRPEKPGPPKITRTLVERVEY
ncbi:hypothetical protein VARIO8X_150014 [Burkholderiales bacterium 8X]|nr:hypothetical protein VARIO8X_150014 [Burkholderiales bacterium 8X]